MTDHWNTLDYKFLAYYFKRDTDIGGFYRIDRADIIFIVEHFAKKVWKWSGQSTHILEKVLKRNWFTNYLDEPCPIQFSIRYSTEYSKSFPYKNCPFLLHLNSRNHSECRILNLILKFFSEPSIKMHHFTSCAWASLNSRGLMQMIF